MRISKPRFSSCQRSQGLRLRSKPSGGPDLSVDWSRRLCGHPICGWPLARRGRNPADLKIAGDFRFWHLADMAIALSGSGFPIHTRPIRKVAYFGSMIRRRRSAAKLLSKDEARRSECSEVAGIVAEGLIL